MGTVWEDMGREKLVGHVQLGNIDDLGHKGCFCIVLFYDTLTL